jgi:hypothetical protein
VNRYIFFFLIFSAQSAMATLSKEKLEPYKQYLIAGTYNGQDWSKFSEKPKSRYETFLKAFELFEASNGKIIVELGTTRSFVDGSYQGCNSSDIRYWRPNNPEYWDWGAGCFTRMVAECLAHTNPEIHTIDLEASALERCKIITADYQHLLKYHQTSSEAFLKSCSFPEGIDLIYLDTGFMNPIEATAQLQLREAKIIVERNLLAPNGIILIDDVRNQNALDDDSGLAKSKYALPYLLTHGFEIIEDGYQVLLKRAK